MEIPYYDPNIRLVSGSRIKQELARTYGLAVEKDEHKLHIVATGEKEYDTARKNGIIIPYYSDGWPYPVHVDLAKETALKPLLDNGEMKISHKHVVTDSDQVVEGSVLCKPEAHTDGTEAGVMEMADFYWSKRGKNIRSETGVVVFDDKVEHIYLYVLHEGIINPNLDMVNLVDYMRDHSAVAGGLDAVGGWDNDFIIPKLPIRWELHELVQFPLTQMIAGGLSFNSANKQSFKGLANGIIK